MRKYEPDRFRRLQVQPELEVRGLFDRQVAGLGATEYAIDIVWNAAIEPADVVAVRQEAPGIGGAKNVLQFGTDFKGIDPPGPLIVMPWPSYRHGTERWMEAVYEYLRAIPCVEGGPGNDAPRC